MVSWKRPSVNPSFDCGGIKEANNKPLSGGFLDFN